MSTLFALLLLVAHAYGITTGVGDGGPWKIDKSELAYSYSTEEKAESYNNPRFVPLSGIHTVRSPTPLTPLTYGFKPLVRTAPNVVFIQPKGLSYKDAATGLVYATGKPYPPSHSYQYDLHAQGPMYSFAPSPTSPTVSHHYVSPTASSQPGTYSQAGSSTAPGFSTQPPPGHTLAPPKPSSNYGLPQPNPSNNYGPPQQKPSDNYGPPQPKPSDNYALPQPKPSDNYALPQPKPSDNYGPPQPKPSDNYGPPHPAQSDSYGPPRYGPPSGIHETASINYGPPHAPYGPPAEYVPALKAPTDEIKFIIYKPQNEEVIKNTLIDHARETGDQIKFVHGPNLEINHDQKVYLPPPKKSIIYILLKEPEIHTKVQVMGANEEGSKPEVFIIYETTDGVIRKHYDLTDEESRRVVSALGDKMRLAKRESEEDSSKEVNGEVSSRSSSNITPGLTTLSPTTTPKSTQN